MKVDKEIPVPIEKEIPIPKRSRYPWAEMEVGDSFAVPDEKVNTISVSALGYGKRHNVKFTIRKTPDGYRCWRTE